MNSISIAGKICKDAETRYAASGSAVVGFSVADNTSKDKAIFWDCTFFGERAAKVAQYIIKGASVTVTGRAEQDEWEDKQTGAKRTKIKVIVTDIALQGGKQEGQRQESAPARQAQPAPSRVADPFEDEDLPFATCAELNDPLFSRHNKGEW